MRRIHGFVFSLVVLSLVLATAAGAQQPERATFYLTVGNDTLTIERIERTPHRLQFQLFDVRTRARVDFSSQLGPRGLISTAGMRIFTSERDTAPAMKVEAQFLDDSVGVTQAGTTNWLRVGRGALPGMNVSATLLEQSLMRARVVGGDSLTIPLLFMPSGPAVPVTILRRGPDSATVRIGDVAIIAAISPEGRLLGATIPSQNARYRRGPATSGEMPGRKSYAPPAGAPYSAHEIEFRTAAGLTLRGTLTLPRVASGGRAPAIVTITGSGAQDRDESLTGVPSYRPYYQLADTLGRRGIAVLRLDDRGAGSDGTPATATTADYADDIRSAVAYLRTRADIDARRVALVGHSEGGTIGLMVASTDTMVAGVVILAGTVSTGREILEFQQRYMVDSIAHFLGQQRVEALAMSARATDSVAAALPWWKFFLAYDGRPAAARLRSPVLILHGEKDYQVPVAEAEKAASAIRGGGNRDVTVRVFPGLNHLFLPYGGPGFSYEKLPSFVVGSEVMGTIADWLSARLKP